MARVNFEDKDELDPRFEPLVQKLRDSDKARGMLVRFWRLAQTSWGMGDKAPIAHPDFERGNLGVLLVVGWAVKYHDGIQAYDAETRFKWYWDCCERSRNVKLKRELKKAELLAAAGQATPAGLQLDSRSTPAGLQLDSRSTPAGLQLDSRSSPDRVPPTPTPTPTPTLYSLKHSGNPQAARQQAEALSCDPAPSDPKAYRFDEVHLELARWMFSKICVKNPTAEKLRSANPEKWANELRLAVETDGIPIAELTKVIRWAFNHSYWQMTIQSPSGLRRNWPTLLERYNGRKESQLGQGEAGR